MRQSSAKNLAQALFEEAGDALFLFDPETDQIQDVNPLAEKLSGFSRPELLKLQATYLFRFSGQGGKQRIHAAANHTTMFHAQDGFLLRTRQDGVWLPVNISITRLHIQPRTMALMTVRDMREQHEAHKRLQGMEQELRRVLASVSDCLWSAVWGEDGNWAYRFISPVVEPLTGRPSAHFMTGLDRWQEIIHEEDRASWQESLRKLRLRHSSQCEYRVQLPGGGLRWLRESVRATRKPEGNALQLDGIVTDITDARLAAQRLLEEQQLLRGLMENLPEAIYYKDPQGRYLVDNAAHRALLGASSEDEVRGKTIHDFFPPPIAARYHADDMGVLAGGEPVVNREEVMQRPGEEARIHSYTKVPLRAADGSLAGLICIGRDVTREREAERQLASERNLLLTLINHLPDHIFVKSLDSRFLIANAATMRSLGVAGVEELVGKRDSDYLPRDQAEKFYEDEQRIAASGEAMLNAEELLIDARGEARWLLTSKLPLRDHDGKVVGIVGVSRDISARRTMEAEFRRARDVAEAANRAKSDFLARMSHEIRTPMHGIMGMTRLALQTQLDSEQRECLEMVQASAEALLHIIDDILDFSRIEAGKLLLEAQAFHIRDSIADAVRSLALKAQQKGLELACHVYPEVPDLLVGDVGRLRQVIINLAGNAVKFTDRGEVVVRARRDEGPVAEGHCRLHFEVSDTGIGIPQEKHRTIFEPFEQVDGTLARKYGGTGLGLAISSQLVSLMGGRMWVESEQGRGSRFHFTSTFRVVDGHQSSQGLAEPADVHGLRVLIVDDNCTHRDILCEMFSGWRMRPSARASAAEALAELRRGRQDGEPYQVVLADSVMPARDGYSLAEEIKNEPGLADAVIMMLTSADLALSSERSRELGVRASVMKPLKQSELLDTILGVVSANAARKPRSIILAPVPTQALSSLPPLRILLAEDNLVNQHFALRVLEKAGHKAHVAANGKLALEALARGAFDVVLMDIQMPEMDGLEATEAIRRRERESGGHVPIIALTAHAMKGDRERCLEAGMDGYVSKPIRDRELFLAMEQALQAHAPHLLPRSPATTPNATSTEGGPMPEYEEKEAVERCGDDRTLLRELIDMFLAELPKWMSALEASLAARDAPAVNRTAHSIKGAVSTFGAEPARLAALALEKAGKEGRLEEGPRLLAELQEALGRLVPALSAFKA